MGVKNDARAMGEKTDFQISHGSSSVGRSNGAGQSGEGGQKETVDVGELGIDVDGGKILGDPSGRTKDLVHVPPPTKN